MSLREKKSLETLAFTVYKVIITHHQSPLSVLPGIIAERPELGFGLLVVELELVDHVVDQGVDECLWQQVVFFSQNEQVFRNPSKNQEKASFGVIVIKNKR